jgi:hypothetical protein
MGFPLECSLITLRDGIYPGFYVKNAILTWTEMNDNLSLISQTINLYNATVANTEAYDAGRTYVYIAGIDIFCNYLSIVYKYVATTNTTGVTPGTNAAVWFPIPITWVAHIHQIIWDPVVITEITSEANWTPNYVGAITGLSEGCYYLDLTNNVKYEYLNANLIRTQFNNFSL